MHLVKIIDYNQNRTDYVQGKDEYSNKVNFIEDAGELVTRDNIIKWLPKGGIKSDSEKKYGPWIKQALIWLINQSK